MKEKRKFVILRLAEKTSISRTKSVDGKPRRYLSIAVESDNLTTGQAAAYRASSEIIGVAPAIPIKLIQPMGKKTSIAKSRKVDVAWGVRAVGADTSAFTGRRIVVAVLDTGIASHPAFDGVTIVRKNFVGDNNEEEDLNGHGTHCAGTIFGRDVEGKRIGVCPGVQTALIGKVIGDRGGDSAQIAHAIEWAARNGAHVISMSLGFDYPGYVRRLRREGMPTDLAVSKALEAYRLNLLLFERLLAYVTAPESFRQPRVIVAAAGNESRRETKPAVLLGAGPPAVSNGVVSVAALAKTIRGYDVATFSNVGAHVSGPGVDVLSANSKGGLKVMSGTSMATPHVAGVVVLWAQKLLHENGLNSQTMLAKLIGTATKEKMRKGLQYGDIGAGLVQAPQN